jgi:hypothetical protein
MEKGTEKVTEKGSLPPPVALFCSTYVSRLTAFLTSTILDAFLFTTSFTLELIPMPILPLPFAPNYGFSGILFWREIKGDITSETKMKIRVDIARCNRYDSSM